MKEQNNSTTILSIFLLILSTILIIVMGIFIFKFYNEKTKSQQLQIQIDDLQSKIENISEEENDTEKQKNSSDNENLYIIKDINISDEQNLYNFKTKKWVKQIDGAEGMFFIAIDSEKNVYIVDRFEKILKKLDIKLEKLSIDDTNIDNYITSAYVSQADNTLVISTGDDLITYIINLNDFSIISSEVNDE